jgi:PIN domain nuclease of toxin-antitoxin system
LRLLLDTNAFIWWRDGSPRLSPRVREQIGDPENDIAVSVTSLWEITIKRALGKLQFLQDFEEVLAEEGFDLLPIGYRHLRALADLPLHHRDPFDRVLIAQAVAERIPIATADRRFAVYGVELLW